MTTVMTTLGRLGRQIKQLLWQHYTAPPRVIFKRFRDGAIYFTVGLMTVLMANANMTPSLTQEIIVLLGLLLGGVGFVMAMTAQLRLLIGRIILFFKNE